MANPVSNPVFGTWAAYPDLTHPDGVAAVPDAARENAEDDDGAFTFSGWSEDEREYFRNRPAPGLGMWDVLRSAKKQLGSWLARSVFGVKKEVSEHVEAWVAEELTTEPDAEPVTEDEGKFHDRPGIYRRMAEEVQLRFNGTPTLSRSNLLLAGRYINELLEASTVRKVDRPRVFYKVRALVFTRSTHEAFGDMVLNSRFAQEQHADGEGWGYLTWLGWVPRLQRRGILSQ